MNILTLFWELILVFFAALLAGGRYTGELSKTLVTVAESAVTQTGKYLKLCIWICGSYGSLVACLFIYGFFAQNRISLGATAIWLSFGLILVQLLFQPLLALHLIFTGGKQVATDITPDKVQVKVSALVNPAKWLEAIIKAVIASGRAVLNTPEDTFTAFVQDNRQVFAKLRRGLFWSLVVVGCFYWVLPEPKGQELVILLGLFIALGVIISSETKDVWIRRVASIACFGLIAALVLPALGPKLVEAKNKTNSCIQGTEGCFGDDDDLVKETNAACKNLATRLNSDKTEEYLNAGFTPRCIVVEPLSGEAVVSPEQTVSTTVYYGPCLRNGTSMKLLVPDGLFARGYFGTIGGKGKAGWHILDYEAYLLTQNIPPEQMPAPGAVETVTVEDGERRVVELDGQQTIQVIDPTNSIAFFPSRNAAEKVVLPIFFREEDVQKNCKFHFAVKQLGSAPKES